MKRIPSLAISTLLLIPVHGQAAETINSHDAMIICKAAIIDRTDGSVYHKFRRDEAVSTRGGKFTLRINSRLKNEQRKYLLKSTCIVSMEGKLLDLEIEEGQW